MIKIDNLTKTFGEKLVLNDLSAVFEPGKAYGIVGANAAGKTTFFRCIAGLEAYEGKIEASQAPVKNVLGYLDSELYFLPKITGEEHVILLTEARGKKVADVGLYNIFNLPLKDYVSTYSTGMKKKLAIMALLLQDNEYFIFDEPYNGLDLQSSIVLTEILLKLKQLDKVILISSHIFSTLRDTCDEIFLLDSGKFVKQIVRVNFTELEEELKSYAFAVNLDKLLKR